MQSILYIEINIFCIVLSILMMKKVIFSYLEKNEQHLLLCVIVNMILLFLYDLIWMIADSAGDYASMGTMITINKIINFLYYAQSGIVAYSCFIYSETIQGNQLVTRRRYKVIFAIPVYILVILDIVSLWTGVLFYIDQNNVYHRGVLFISQVVIALGYLFMTGIKALILAIDKSHYVEKSKLISLTMFVIIPVITELLQVCLPCSTLINIGMTFSLVNLVICIQNEMISSDSLTQLNNRKEMIRFLSEAMKNQPSSKKLYILMMDIDSFKQINDRFGHIRGDEALQFLADVLKKVAVRKDCFVARYGGDEFVVIYEAESQEDVDHLSQIIHNDIKVNNHTGIPISVSIGICVYNEEMKQIPDFIEAADQRMYQVKREKKSRPATT